MEVRLYHFNKRVNSTASPSKTSGTLYEGNVVDNCSMFKPRILMNIATPSNFNYAYISEFNRFYHIRNWTWESPYWVAEMECDVLGSFKSVILATEQYVERAYDNNNANSLWNSYAIDTAYPATANTTITANSTTSPFSEYSIPEIYETHDYFVIGAVAKDDLAELGLLSTSMAGSARYYGVGWNTYNKLINELSDPGDWYSPDISTLDNINTQLWNALCNPMKYIFSVKWFPFAIQEIDSNFNSDMYLGNYRVSDLTWQQLRSIKKEFSGSWSIPKHPKSSRGDFLNSQMYADYCVFVPPFGIVSIPTEALIGYQTLYYKIIVDLISGKGHMKLYVGSESNVIASQDATVGQPTALAQTSINYDAFSSPTRLIATGAGIATQIAGNVIDWATGPDTTLAETASSITNATSNISDSIMQSFMTLNKDGSNGGDYIDFYSDWLLIGKFKDIVDKDDADLGRPVMKKLTLSSLGEGFCKVYAPDFDFNTHTDDTAMTQDEVAEVNRFMVNGFFIK